MAYPKRLLSEGEHVVREFRPHWRLLVIPAGWTLLFVAAVVATWVFPPEQPGQDWAPIFDWTVTALAGAAFVRLGLYPFIQWWFTWYVLTNERLITRRGVLARRGLEIPLENVNDIRFSQSILERMLHSGDLLIESAGEQGQSRFHDIPEPEEFQSLLYRIREERAVQLQTQPGLAAALQAGEADSMTRLERLAKLYQDGMITAEEYEAKKQALLDEM
jgi:uncharacterized membrane protein YdbT with pleckstrin-like domain